MQWLSEFGMREWLICCGVILVLVVLFDGFRRMRQEHKKEIKMARKMGGSFPEAVVDKDDFGSELPNGGARVVARTEPSITETEAIDTASQVEDFQETLSTIEAAEQIQSDAQDAARSASTQYVDDQQILVVHAKARSERGFNGSDLLQVLLACDMRYGDRDILHRHERAGGTGSLQFSVANMLEPGTFNLEDINTFKTPGVTFFMTIPGPENPEQAFNCMLETANCLVKNLDAKLLDESHQLLNDAMLSTYRSRVQSVAAQDIKQTDTV